MNTHSIVQKLWNYCNVLRDDGMSYGDYVEQLTYLLFLKMADERTKAPYNQKSPVPEKIQLAEPDQERRRRAVRPLPPHPGGAGQREGPARADLQQVAEQVPGPGQAAAADRRPHRQGKLGVDERRREGRCLRGPAGEERPGHQVRRRPVLHPAPADPGHCGCHGPEARRDRERPGLRHRRLSARGARLCGEAQPAPDQAAAQGSSRRRPSRAGSWCRPRRGCAP